MQFPLHGSRTRGEASFGRLSQLDELTPAIFTNEQLARLASEMASAPDVAKDGPDDEENPYVPAGYTYLGQFIDHDLTFDAHSNFDDPKALSTAENQRTPRFDLDNVYGRGPEDQPYLYSDNFDGKLLLGADLLNGVSDVQRNVEGRAIIGDPRNDENSIVTQLQSAFIRFHNALVDVAPPGSAGVRFEWARRQARLHYQRIVLDDFLPRIVDTTSSTVAPLLRALGVGATPPLRLYDMARGSYMPIEFSVAAYRFGHSMIRPGYRLSRGPDRLFPIFDGETAGLRGFKRLDPDRGIDWSLFFTNAVAAGMRASDPDIDANNAKGEGRTQFAYKIDTKLVSNLSALPEKVASVVHSLAERNLRRGRDFGLPSGQAAANRLGLKPLEGPQLTFRDGNFKWDANLPEGLDWLGTQAPLWFYILAEAQLPVRTAVEAGQPAVGSGSRLGELGGLIVAETFIGLMLADGQSVLNLPTWTSVNGRSTFSVPELLAFIGTPLPA